MVKYTSDKIGAFVKEYIEDFNNSPNNYKTSNPNDTEIKEYLKAKFIKELPEKKDVLIKKLEEYDYKKSKIKDIASEFGYYKKDLETFYSIYLYKEVLEQIDTNDMVEALKNLILEKTTNEQAFRYIKSDFEKMSQKVMQILKIKGFSTNLLGINSGIMLANSGDSAQFLFLSRAILAGFNCSNVDVRSSRYDAIIDFEGKLLKVQVKGISDNNINFKDRDRGGQGIDHTHERNKGKIISSEDCDIYVAVDKQCGICYIIPVKEYIDKLDEEQKEKAIKINTIEKYRENWNVIIEVAKSR